MRTCIRSRLAARPTFVAASCLALFFPVVSFSQSQTDDYQRKTEEISGTLATKWLANPRPVPNADARTAAGMRAYTEEVRDGFKFDMLPIPGGTFTMGSPAGEKGREASEGPRVQVTIDPFWVGKYEVTWAEYETWVYSLDIPKRTAKEGEASERDRIADILLRPSEVPGVVWMEVSSMGKGRKPAICMTQYAAEFYCNWLTAKTGRYYRLPTEAEWEYACRAGTNTAYSFGDDPAMLKDCAVYEEDSNGKPAPVGTKKPNPWGLFDMHGNVAEWVLDQFDAKTFERWAAKPQKNPYVIATKEYPRTVRGGSWLDDPEYLRSAARLGSSEDWKARDPQLPQSLWWMADATFVGFRVVRPLHPPTDEEAKKYEPDIQNWKDYWKATGRG